MFQSISNDEFYQKTKKEKLNVLDVREQHEYNNGHIADSLNIPLSEFTADNLSKLDKDKEYYVLCYSGARSTTACNYLGKQGYNAVNVLGGISSWKGNLE